MKIIDAAVAYAKEHRSDGFVFVGECACSFEDVMPCGCWENVYSCELGRLVEYGSPECADCEEPEICEEAWCVKPLMIDASSEKGSL